MIRDLGWPTFGLVMGVIVGSVMFIVARIVFGIMWPETCIFWIPVVAALIGFLFGWLYFDKYDAPSLPVIWFLVYFIVGLFVINVVVSDTPFGMEIVRNPLYTPGVLGLAAGLWTIGIMPLLKTE